MHPIRVKSFRNIALWPLSSGIIGQSTVIEMGNFFLLDVHIQLLTRVKLGEFIGVVALVGLELAMANESVFWFASPRSNNKLPSKLISNQKGYGEGWKIRDGS